MRRERGPSVLSLLHRATVLSGLVLRAAALYLEVVIANRGLWASAPAARVARQQAFAARFVDVASRFRGGLIKIGQVASLRVDVVPEEVTRELERLQDRVDPHPFDEIERRLVVELGAPMSEKFEAFEREPLAAASLGQVHRARSRDGRDLAVKVLYPGIGRSVAVDLAMMKLALRLFDLVTVGDLLEVHRQVRASLQGEMDYLREGRAAEEIERNLAGDPKLARHTRVPKIHWDLTTRAVLSMEFIEGDKINDSAALEARGIDRDDLVLWASRAFLHMMFHDGFFHCDPHPGNLLVDSEGRIGIIDFGMNQRVEPGVLAAVRDNVVASIARDSERYAQSLLRAGMIDEADVPAVVEMAEIGFDPKYFNLTPVEVAELDFGEYFRRMRGSMKKLRGFHLPEGLVMWSRAISLLYGLMVELAPGIRPLDVVGPYVLEFLAGARGSAVNPGVSDASKSV